MASEHAVQLMKRTYEGVMEAQQDPEKLQPMNIFAVLLFMITTIVAAGALVLFDYTFQVVKILTIVEDIPNDWDLATAVGTDDENEEDDTPKAHSGLYLGGSPDVADKFITSSFRKTLRYLREEAGIFSPWRGFSVNVAYVISASVLNGIFKVLLPFPGGRYIAGCLVLLCVSPLSLVHTHVILAQPTKETWFGRLARLPYKSILHTLPAMMLLAITGQATYAFPTLLLRAFIPRLAFDSPVLHKNTPYQSMLTPLQAFALYSVFLACHVLLFIPSMVILFRVQASVYPTNEESIIPFERRAPMSVIEAWQTWTRSGKKRLIRLYAKVLPLVFITSLSVGTILFWELGWVLGDKKYIMHNILQQWLRNQTGWAP